MIHFFRFSKKGWQVKQVMGGEGVTLVERNSRLSRIGGTLTTRCTLFFTFEVSTSIWILPAATT
jgi:hypothetical protein